MGYKLNKTDGTLLVDLVDGQLDILTTSNRLKKIIQDLVKSNENMIQDVGEFLSTHLPSKTSLKGQLWYDTARKNKSL